VTQNNLHDMLTKNGNTIIVVVPNLENGITNQADILCAQQGVNTDMSKQLKDRVQIGTDEKGLPIYKWATGQTKQELQASIARIIVEAGIVSGITPGQAAPSKPEKTLTVEEFILETYIPTFMTNLAPTTRENYRQYINLNILPFMGNFKMDQVTVTTVQQFYDWMATAAQRGRKQNLNQKTIERISGLASRIFKVAFEMKVIDDTPFKKTLLTIHAEEADHHHALPDELVYRVKQEIPLLTNRDERLYMALLAYTGMRPEEIRGIAWEELNLEEQFGTIRKAVTYPGNNKAHIGKPKSKRSGRTILLPKPLVDILLPERQPCGFVCGGAEPWGYTKAARVSNAAFEKLGIDQYTDYDFRSTFGTQLKEMGMTSAQVADVMGHADTRMVETVYARARHEGIMKQLSVVEKLAFVETSG